MDIKTIKYEKKISTKIITKQPRPNTCEEKTQIYTFYNGEDKLN